jgi:hypothetical protein
MFAVNFHSLLDYRSSRDSAYFAPRSNSLARKASGWGMAVKPLPFALPSRPVLLQIAQTVAQVLAKQVNTGLLEDLHSKDCENQALIAKVNRLEGIVQQLLQQQESRIATVAQPRTSPAQDLAPIAAIYGALDAEQTAFLQKRPHLIPALLRAKELLYKRFDTQPPLTLALSNGNSAYPDLFIEVHTALPMSAAAAHIESFAEQWRSEPVSDSHVDIIATLHFG